MITMSQLRQSSPVITTSDSLVSVCLSVTQNNAMVISDESVETLITSDHLDRALSDARCSVSPDDVLRYKQFAKTLRQSRGIGARLLSAD